MKMESSGELAGGVRHVGSWEGSSWWAHGRGPAGGVTGGVWRGGWSGALERLLLEAQTPQALPLSFQIHCATLSETVPLNKGVHWLSRPAERQEGFLQACPQPNRNPGGWGLLLTSS